MSRRDESKPRPSLTVSREEAKQRVNAQIDKARNLPNESVNENDDVRRWYDFTAELLRQFFTTDEVTDEFTGRGSISIGGEDISTGYYLRKLTSIYERIDLYPELVNSNLTRGVVTPLSKHNVDYVASDRLNELSSIKDPNFDLSKLIALCVEINKCYANDCLLAVAMSTRAILDHVPPIFGCRIFAEVANNYRGSKSFRESMQHLENSSRKIADSHLHVQIRSKETLPNKVQVNFANDLDVLLSEIVRILK